jgi:hypothetical protein
MGEKKNQKTTEWHKYKIPNQSNASLQNKNCLTIFIQSKPLLQRVSPNNKNCPLIQKSLIKSVKKNVLAPSETVPIHCNTSSGLA